MESWAGGLRGAVETILFRGHCFGWVRQLGPSDDRLDTQLDLLHVVPREHSAADHIETWIDVVDSHLHHVGEIIENSPHIGLSCDVVLDFGLHPGRKLPIQKNGFAAADKQVVAVAPLPARRGHFPLRVVRPRMIHAPLGLKIEAGLDHLDLIWIEPFNLPGLNRLVHRRPPKRDRVRRLVVILLVQRANFQSLEAGWRICGVAALTVIVIHYAL